MSKSPAIYQSLARLDKARDALKRLETAKSLNEGEGAWSDLLIAGNAVYSKLEQGSKAAGGKAAGWFGRIKKTRKDDPLLSYMHHARNSDEHGIEDITKRMGPGQATITIREPFDPAKLAGVKLVFGPHRPGHVQVSSSNEDVISTKIYDKPSLVLVRVKDDRYTDYFDPPYEHLGAKLSDQAPAAVGKMFVEYLSDLIKTAKSFGI